MKTAPKPVASNLALPSRELSRRQADWLRGARTRLLRQAGIAKRRRLLDLAAGWGLVAPELRDRSGGTVIAADSDRSPLSDGQEDLTGCACIQASAQRLPFADNCFDLIFAQCAFLWFSDPLVAATEAYRVLSPNGVVAILEPDYGGLIEYPEEVAVRDLWITSLKRAGADPMMGRRLPSLLADAGFQSDVFLLDRLEAPHPARFDLLEELPLEDTELAQLRQARDASGRRGTIALAHLPLFLVLARKANFFAAIDR